MKSARVRTLQSHSVPLQALHGLLEESLTRGGHTRDIVLLPLYGSVDVFKDVLDRLRDFLADTVSWDESDLLPGKFGSLEDRKKS